MFVCVGGGRLGLCGWRWCERGTAAARTHNLRLALHPPPPHPPPPTHSFRYRLPLHVHIPAHAVLLGLLMWLRPAAPFCRVIQTPATRALFHAIANK